MKQNSNRYWDDFYTGGNHLQIYDCYDNWLDNYTAYFKPDMCVLDLGCGVGMNLPAILKSGTDVVAADFSEIALDIIKTTFSKWRIQTCCFDMRDNFPFFDDTFDIIVADLSLHYFGKADMRHIVCEMKRVLKQSGALIARVHSINQIRTADCVEIEPGFYYCDGYCRKYFTEREIRDYFSRWKITALEQKTIYRYNQKKEIFEFTALNTY